MRLAEVIGLTASDVHLDEEVPFVRLSEHPWRRLKTAESERDVPLVGATLWGLKRALECSDGGLLFPRYCTPEGNKANYASSALNKWLDHMCLTVVWCIRSGAACETGLEQFSVQAISLTRSVAGKQLALGKVMAKALN